MPSVCCVLLCKGNYPTGPKVSVLSFPQNKENIKKWLHAIQRKNFESNKNSRVCELHFKDSDFKTDTCGFDDKTGKMISVPLKIRRLKETAVPSVFPNYPSCNVSEVHSSRKCPDNKRTEWEMKNLEKGLTESIVTFEKYEESRKELEALRNELLDFMDSTATQQAVRTKMEEELNLLKRKLEEETAAHKNQIDDLREKHTVVVLL